MNEQAFRNLISGRTQGPVASMLRAVLLAMSAVYRLFASLRNMAFNRGWRSARKVGVPVISVGNLTTGGTGKTPVVAFIVHTLQQMNHRPGIVSRGYGSVNGQPNDEKLVLERICPGVPHEQSASRYDASLKLLSQSDTSILVMDDGFQHRALHRDLEIVLIDATNPFGYEYLLPRGLLREPLTSLDRAHVVLITRADLVPDSAIQNIIRTVTDKAPHLKETIFSLRFRPAGLIRSSGERIPLGDLANNPAVLVSGIGNPEAFQESCVRSGIRVAAVRWFADHHCYSMDDEKEIRNLSKTHQNARIITTLKDMVKLSPQSDVLAMAIEAEFLDGKDRFEAVLSTVCQRKTTENVHTEKDTTTNRSTPQKLA